MNQRMWGLLLLMAAALGWSGSAKAWQSCQDVVVGMYANNQPVLQSQCEWLAGAVALDPASRAMGSVWNYSDADQAKAAAQRDCGPSCLVVSFYDDYFYLAASDDDAIGYAATADEAVRQCVLARPGARCDVVVSAGSGGRAVYWPFNALGYNGKQQKAYATAGGARRRDARQAVLQLCGGEPDCFAYVHQLAHAAMALGADGELYASEGNSAGQARRAAKKYCAAEQGGKAKCEIVAETGKAAH
jgi:hypothetical protein